MISPATLPRRIGILNLWCRSITKVWNSRLLHAIAKRLIYKLYTAISCQILINEITKSGFESTWLIIYKISETSWLIGILDEQK